MRKNLSDIIINICSVVISILFIKNRDRCFEFAEWIIMKYIRASEQVKDKTILTAAYIDYYGKILDKIHIEFKN